MNQPKLAIGTILAILSLGLGYLGYAHSEEADAKAEVDKKIDKLTTIAEANASAISAVTANVQLQAQIVQQLSNIVGKNSDAVQLNREEIIRLKAEQDSNNRGTRR